MANVRYDDTGKWESARTEKDFAIIAGALPAMVTLAASGYALFLVSNQPNQAKGKASEANHEAIHSRLMAELAQAVVPLQHAYYCFHHPQASVKRFLGPCPCRKPEPFFLFEAARDFGVDLSRSWMVGDRETDVECGRRASTSTVRIYDGPRHSYSTAADYLAPSLAAAAKIICELR